MSKPPYKPIACADYDIYEIAIMQKRLLSIKWKDQSGDSQAVVKPLNLQIKDSAEYLVFELIDEEVKNDSKKSNMIRLDEILTAVYFQANYK